MTAEAQLKQFIAKFDPAHQTLLRAARRGLRKRMPAANELVYDNYNFFVIGYSPTEKPSDAIRGGSSGIGLCFIYGATLRDPQKILLGSGNQTRFIRLPSADVLARPEVEALLAQAIAAGNAPLPSRGRGKLIIRSIAAKQRSRKVKRKTKKLRTKNKAKRRKNEKTKKRTRTPTQAPIPTPTMEPQSRRPRATERPS